MADYLEELYGPAPRTRKSSFWCVNSGSTPAVEKQRVYAKIDDGSIICLDDGSPAPDGYAETKFVCCEGAAPGHLVKIEATPEDLLVGDCPPR